MTAALVMVCAPVVSLPFSIAALSLARSARSPERALVPTPFQSVPRLPRLQDNLILALAVLI